MDYEDQKAIDYIRTQVRYDPDSGHFYNLVSNRKGGIGAKTGYQHILKGLPSYVGMNFRLPGSDKYRYYGAHRVAWALYYNRWPNEEIDHINNVKNDNRIANLQDVTHGFNTIKSCKGRVTSAETKKKISASGTGKKRSAEFRELVCKLNDIRDSGIGNKEQLLAEYHRKKASALNKGNGESQNFKL